MGPFVYTALFMCCFFICYDEMFWPMVDEILHTLLFVAKTKMRIHLSRRALF